MKPLFFLMTILGLWTVQSCSTKQKDTSLPVILYSEQKTEIDGKATEKCWQKTDWKAINHRWLGKEYSQEDFQGRYKILWTTDFIYLLVEIQDDSLIDIHKDGLEKYWDDDCVELFIDEDASGGNHQYNHQAFAYHISLENRAVDIGTDSLPLYFDEHIKSKWKKTNKKYTWEIQMALYDDRFSQNSTQNKPVKLTENKKIGFAIAYCDNDTSAERENFIGSVEGGEKNEGWIISDIFEKFILKK